MRGIMAAAVITSAVAVWVASGWVAHGAAPEVRDPAATGTGASPPRAETLSAAPDAGSPTEADRDRGTREQVLLAHPPSVTLPSVKESPVVRAGAEEPVLPPGVSMASSIGFTNDGAVFSRLPADSIFSEMGLQNGDVVMSINGKPVRPETMAQSLMTLMSGKAAAYVLRDGHAVALELKLPVKSTEPRGGASSDLPNNQTGLQ